MTGPILLILRLLLLASLYAFVGWALYVLWKDLRRQSQVVSFIQTPSILLTNPDGQVICRFTKPEFSVGRDPGCDCTLEDKTVSTHHARFSFHHNQWWVEDLGSTNGTFLNEEQVHTPVVITTGDELRCGQIDLKIAVGEQLEGTVIRNSDVEREK